MALAADLVLGSYSLGGSAAPQRNAAAAAAGFTGASALWREIVARRAAGEALAAMRAEFTDAGLAAPQLEIITLPGAAGLAAFEDEARDIAETAAAMGCEVVNAAALDRTASENDLVEGLGLLATACGRLGLTCGIEFVPFLTGAPDLESAMRITRAVGLPNAGIVMDSLHFFRSGAQWAALGDLRPGEVVALQVNDGPAERPNDDYHAEAMGMRRLPGEGDFDLDRFLGVLIARGTTVALTAEVVSRELDALAPAEAARRMAEATRALRRR